MPRRWDYRRMTPDELSTALDRLDMTADELAKHVGSARERVIRCLKGQEDIPPSTFLLCRLWLDVPGALELTRDHTDHFATRRTEEN
ncbi:MAG: hypothetical protein EA385_15135 [Salinarimonadaceae bacterium]|nr:MAG: hypothetical protein EA385_15135 [Salinarimonadaceae bacterium]